LKISKWGRGFAVLTILSAFVLAVAAGAGAGNGNGNGHAYGRDGIKPVPADVKVKKPSKKKQQELAEQADAIPGPNVVTTASTTPPINTVRVQLGINFITGGLIGVTSTLRGVGQKSEIWVQNNRTFPTGDCRNTDAADLAITDAQVQTLIDEFDNNMYPTEAKLFSTPPNRDGTNETLHNGLSFTGDGDKIVVIVMNIRDENYFDMSNANGFGYVVGYHSSSINELTDRNTMTIDAFDWIHRSGANPPDNPVEGADKACKSRPAFPYRMESTFAHEYQHLLEYYASPGEQSWVNEGLSDYAMRKTGYARPELPHGTIGEESHLQCFYGNLDKTLGGVPYGGPENGLTWWEDQGDGEVLCDYGAAWSMMEYLEGQFGEQFMTALHKEKKNGFVGLQAVLDNRLTGRNAQDIVHQWLASVALDNVLDTRKFRANSHDASLYRIPTLAAAVNWDSLQSYGSDGAPPNGADFVRLRNAAGTYVNAGQLQSISFSGQKQYAPDPVGWKVVDGALSADLTEDLANRTLGREITVPAASPTLTFKGKYDLEEHWDYGFVQISDDGGKTYKSVACSNTNSDNVPNAHPLVLQYVPGYSGVQATFQTETCNLSAYAGKTVILMFRGVTDWGTRGNDEDTANDGWFVDDVTLGGTLLSDGTSLAGWKSETEILPVKVAGWTVQLLGYHSDGTEQVVLGTLPLDASFTGSLANGNLHRLLGGEADVVGALVTYDEPTETIQKYPRYELKVNGVLQPGG
jgi:hypothetical protein